MLGMWFMQNYVIGVVRPGAQLIQKFGRLVKGLSLLARTNCKKIQGQCYSLSHKVNQIITHFYSKSRPTGKNVDCHTIFAVRVLHSNELYKEIKVSVQ